jgi:ribosome-binding protein aMBF1 (putative translation factor)
MIFVVSLSDFPQLCGMIREIKTNMKTYNVSAELNQTFGAPGTKRRKRAEEQAWEEYNAQIRHDDCKESGMNQSELATKIGAEN